MFGVRLGEAVGATGAPAQEQEWCLEPFKRHALLTVFCG